ncbi:MAG TPA: ATP-binding domain-containing protein [Acidimicrobiales bacterium]|nr:ATP-binding domain-containing protein [Acidimicrobiales bacterium]
MAAPDTTTTTDDELESEQSHVDLAYQHLDRMKARAEQLLAAAPADPDLEATLKRRIFQLTDNGRSLCFGRIDTSHGETWHIGRRHVEDADSEPVVVEWRAPVAIPFYRATIEEPLGLEMRRQFVLDGRTILQMADDLFGDEAVARAGDGPQVRGRDALLAELDRARTGQMLDIVATIQAEQDVVIRAPIETLLCVQGGPGTGKTAIGLHRAAYLLYGNDALARAGVLVLGPNRTFLRYIAQVLPSLGEEAVVQTTLVDLVPDAPVRAVDAPEAARIKGDDRMAEVLRRALLARRRPPDGDLEVRHNLTRVVVERDAIAEIFDTVASRRIPYADGRRTLRELLARAVYERYAGRAAAGLADTFQEVFRTMTTSAPFKATVDRLWPNVSAPQLVREVLTRKQVLAAAADGLLSDHEQRLLLRKAGRSLRLENWTEADGPLVDEAIELVDGRLRTYGHAVVDEAQDWSPMQARMLARRVPTGSITILGDIAQGTGVWGRDDWEDLLRHLPARHGVRREELRLGYRAPAKVLAVASKLLPHIAPDLQPTESIRPGRSDPRFIDVDESVLAGEVAAEAARLAKEWASVAVIVPAALHDAVEGALAASAGVDVGDAEAQGLDHAVTVVPATTAKGLEFDAVIVVEPTAIVEDAPNGLRLLYIALTRPTQHLTVVHAQPLPPGLAGG